MTDQLKAAQLALDKAKIALMTRKNMTFYMVLTYSLKHRFTYEIPTAATDGLTVLYNPDFFLSLDKDEELFLVLHEVSHVAYKHMLRITGRDPRNWNIAGDYVINGHLVDMGLKMPASGLYDSRYDGMSTEEVYRSLPPPPPEGCPIPGFGDDVIYVPLPDGTEQPSPDAIQAQIDQILIKASIQSRMNQDAPGSIPGQIQIYLDELLNPRLPWQRILQQHTAPLAKNDYTWQIPNRRYFPRYHLPGMRSEQLKNLAIAIDTSGSVEDHQFQQMISEAHYILKRLRPKQITLVQFDTRIRHENVLKKATDFQKISFSGRGGTNVTPVLHWANTHKPELLLIFTDGDFPNPKVDTKVNVLWLIHNNPGFTPPVGRAIPYTL